MVQIENTASAREQVDVVRRVLLRKWWLIVLLSLVSGLAAFGTAKLLSPVYQTSTTVRILREQKLAEGPMPQSTRELQSLRAEKSWFTSRQVLEAVVKRLALAESTPATPTERVMARVKGTIRNLLGRPERADTRYFAILDQLQKKCITVQEIPGSSVLEITVNWSDPEMTMRIANTLVDVFVEQFKEFNRGRSREKRTYLEQQVQLVANQLKESENALVDFQKSTGLINMGDKTAGASAQGEPDRLATEKRQLELEYASGMSQLAELDAQAAALSVGKNTINKALRAALANPSSLLRMLMAQAATIETDAAKSGQTLEEKSPTEAVRNGQSKDTPPHGSRASKELEGIKGRLRQELKQLKAEPTLSLNDLSLMIPEGGSSTTTVDRTSLAARVKVLKEQLDNLELEMVRAKKESQELPADLQRSMTLNRDKRVNEELYTMLCQQLAGAQVDENSNLYDVRVFDPALLPVEPIKPKPVLLAGMGTLMGLLLGVCFAFSLEYLNDSLRTSAEIQAYLGVPVLAEIPKVRARGSLTHTEDPRVRWRRIS